MITKYVIAMLITSVLLAGCIDNQTTAPVQPKKANVTEVTELKSTEIVEPASENNKVFSQKYTFNELDNGLRVLIVKTDYPDLVSLQIPVFVGSRDEDEMGKTGFAHFFEHMMFKGSKNILMMSTLTYSKMRVLIAVHTRPMTIPIIT